jgi:hypothetical protein
MSHKAFTIALGLASLIATTGLAEARTVTRHFTGAHGGVGQGTITRAPGLREREASFTGPKGRTRSVDDARTWDRAAGTRTHDRARTFADGTQRTIDADSQRVVPGTYDVDRTVTQRDGDVITRSGTVTVTH